MATGGIKLSNNHDEIMVEQVACGVDFTVCIGENGQVYSWGSSEYGCLGRTLTEDEEGLGYVTKPRSIDAGHQYFGNNPVEQLSCGAHHVLARTSDGSAYSWGRGELGCLGHGDEDDREVPTRVVILNSVGLESKVDIIFLCAGDDASSFVTDSGKVYSCGENLENRLGLNRPQSVVAKLRRQRTREAGVEVGMEKGEVTTALTPLPAHAINRKVRALLRAAPRLDPWLAQCYRVL